MDEQTKRTISKLMGLIEERHEVTPNEASGELGIEQKDILEAVRVLEGYDILEIRYHHISDVSIQKSRRLMTLSPEDQKTLLEDALRKEESNENTEAERLLSVIRERRVEKRRQEST